ncbi:hypothetical protein AB7942_12915 [Neobacillus sp. BF23-41]|uniref:hypothetical protein n=1 Tax=Neobacillus sp. BF23-41 TaxID=3240280 RepID=UPI0034E42988
MSKEVITKPEINSDPSGIEQPLMTTGTTEPGFDWNSDEGKQPKKPMIGNTVVGEEDQ